MKPNYTIQETAVLLHVSTDTVRRLIKRKLLRRSLAVRRILIPAEDVDNFMANTASSR